MEDKTEKETKENTTTNSENEQLSSFILQSNSVNDQHEENIPNQLETSVLISQIYEEEFFDHFHLNYYGELEQDGFFLMSIRSVPSKIKSDNEWIHAIIRTEKQDYNLNETINLSNESNVLTTLLNKIELSRIQYYGIVHHLKANETILEHDKLIDDEYSHKIGLVYQCLNQNNENDILNNNQMSKEMEDFLNLLSDRIELKNFHSYRGDLDVQTNEHGFYSYFTKYANHQIMFNVSPIISSDKTQQDFLHRKSLIGNALICIVFQEQGAFFKPEYLSGKVTQIYLTVQPIQRDAQLFYKIEIWRRSDIKPIVIPFEGMFKCDESFRNSFLDFLLNLTNLILKKDFFQQRIVKQRQAIRSESLKKLCQTFYFYSTNQSIPFANSSDDDLDADLYKLKRKNEQKRRRLTIFPKIINTLSNNPKRTNSVPHLTKRVSQHQQENSQPTTDPISSLVTQFGHFIGAHTNTSTANQQKRQSRISQADKPVEQLII